MVNTSNGMTAGNSIHCVSTHSKGNFFKPVQVFGISDSSIPSILGK